jgi:arylsulfatase A-like enzyme
MASVMTGVYPSIHGAYDYDRKLNEKAVTLAEILQNRGYRTAAIIFSAYLRASYGFSQGFEEFEHFGMITGRSEVSSDRITNLATDWVANNGDDPFFLFVHFFDPHYHYIRHEEMNEYSGPVKSNHDIYELRKIQELLTDEGLDRVRDLYDQEVRFTDHHIGVFLDFLRERGIEDNTIVLIASDHGDEFLEHGWIGHVTNLYEGMVHVPLIVTDPREQFVRAVVDEPVEIHRIGATILDLLSLEVPDASFGGGSLVPLMRGEAERPDSAVFGSVFFSREDKRAMRRSVRNGKLKLIYDYDDETFELYDLGADPGETTNVVAQGPQILGELKELLAEWASEMDRHRVRSDESGRIDLDADALEQLKALGYVQ